MNGNILESFNVAYSWEFNPIIPNEFVSFLVCHPDFLSIRNYCFTRSIINNMNFRYEIKDYTSSFRLTYSSNDFVDVARSYVVLDLSHNVEDNSKRFSFQLEYIIEFDNQYNVHDMKISHYDYYSQLKQIGDSIDVSDYSQLNDAIHSHPLLNATLTQIVMGNWFQLVFGLEKMFPSILSNADTEAFIESYPLCKYNLIINRNSNQDSDQDSDQDKIWVTYEIKPQYDSKLTLISAQVIYNSYHYTPYYKNRVDGSAIITADGLEQCILDHPVIKNYLSHVLIPMPVKVSAVVNSDAEEIVLLDPKPTFVTRAINRWNQLFSNLN
jgi:hypothetical protein